MSKSPREDRLVCRLVGRQCRVRRVNSFNETAERGQRGITERVPPDTSDLRRQRPEHQAVVRLTTIRKRWKEIKEESDGCLFGYALARLREQPYCDGVVLCVPLRAKKDCVAELASMIKRLRKLGIADSP